MQRTQPRIEVTRETRLRAALAFRSDMQRRLTSWEPICGCWCDQADHQSSTVGPHMCEYWQAWKCEFLHTLGEFARRRKSRKQPYPCGCHALHLENDHQSVPLPLLHRLQHPTFRDALTWTGRALAPVGPLRVELYKSIDADEEHLVTDYHSVVVKQDVPGLFPLGWAAGVGDVLTWAEWVEKWKRAVRWKHGAAAAHHSIRRNLRKDADVIWRSVSEPWVRSEVEQLAIDSGLVQFERRLTGLPVSVKALVRRAREYQRIDNRLWRRLHVEPWNEPRCSIARYRDACDVMAGTWPLVRHAFVRPILHNWPQVFPVQSWVIGRPLDFERLVTIKVTEWWRPWRRPWDHTAWLKRRGLLTT